MVNFHQTKNEKYVAPFFGGSPKKIIMAFVGTIFLIGF
jgi:hypothetical protein